MTNAELIAKLRAEIDKLYGEYKDKLHQSGDQYHLGLIDGLDMAERVLDTLESEHLADARKTSPNDLEEAAGEYAREYNGGDDWEDDIKFTFIAGAKWQADHTPLPEDTVLFYKGVEEGKRLMMEEMSERFAQLKQVQSESINISAVREQLAYNRGASDERYKMRKKMMEEAVEGQIVSRNDGWNSIELPSTFFGELSKNYKHGDKVRIIIIKEG